MTDVQGHQQHPRSETRERLRDANFAGAIYGQILVLSVLAALGPRADVAGTVAAVVAGSQLTFWLAHAYAELIAKHVQRDQRLTFAQAGAVLEHEWPLVQAAIPTLVLMLIAGVGVIEARTGVYIALGLGIAQLFAWGYYVGHQSGRSPFRQLLVALVSGMIGLLMVALKLALH